MSEQKIYYRRHLPHYQPPDGIFFVTFRLAGSLPIEVVKQLKEELVRNEKKIEKIKDKKQQKDQLKIFREKYFIKFDEQLNKNMIGPIWLQNPAIANLVKDAIHYRDGKVYELLAYCIMPNHVHLVFDLSHFNKSNLTCSYEVTKILSSLKKHTAIEANKLLNRSGAFWQHESYDHLVRNEKELERIIYYVLNNPVKAGFVENWWDWEWCYVAKDKFDDLLPLVGRDAISTKMDDSANFVGRDAVSTKLDDSANSVGRDVISTKVDDSANRPTICRDDSANRTTGGSL